MAGRYLISQKKPLFGVLMTQDKWYSRSHSLHIRDDEWCDLTVDQRIKLREMHSKRKASYYATAATLIVGLVSLVAGGLFIRDSDLKDIYEKINKEPNIEILLRADNIEQQNVRLLSKISYNQRMLERITAKVQDMSCRLDKKKCDYITKHNKGRR